MNIVLIIVFGLALISQCEISLATELELHSPDSMTISFVDQKMQRFQETHQMSGAVAVTLGDRVVYARGFGIADNTVTPAQLCSPDTQFFIGSVTKQFTAAAVLHVLYAQHGDVDALREALHKPLSEYLPASDSIWAGDMPLWANHVTLHHLLTHTSGIVSYTSVESFKSNCGNPISRSALVCTFKNEPVRFEPGEKYEYCNSGYFLLGEVVERLSGMNFSQYLADCFFNQLGMMSTFLPDGDTGGIMKDSGDYPNLSRGYTCELKHNSPLTEISPYWHNSYQCGAFGIVSTVNDLLVWNRKFHNEMVLPPAVTALMLTEHVVKNMKAPHHYYCYGICKSIQDEKIIFEHDGSISGFRIVLAYHPQERLSFVSFQNIGMTLNMALLNIPDVFKKAQEIHKELRLTDSIEYEKRVTEIIMKEAPNEFARYVGILPPYSFGLLNM